MTTTINASTSAGLVITSDTTGDLSLQSNGTTKIAITSTGAAIAGTLTGGATMLSPITNSLSGDVALNNTALYFDGPSVAQGTVGTWFVSGSVSINGGGNNVIYVKLWDGTTVIASGYTTCDNTTGVAGVVHLAGFITTPAGNLRISARDITATSGSMLFNITGNSKDCNITAIRIG